MLVFSPESIALLASVRTVVSHLLAGRADLQQAREELDHAGLPEVFYVCRTHVEPVGHDLGRVFA
jgi:hypothetical protein